MIVTFERTINIIHKPHVVIRKNHHPNRTHTQDLSCNAVDLSSSAAAAAAAYRELQCQQQAGGRGAEGRTQPLPLLQVAPTESYTFGMRSINVISVQKIKTRALCVEPKIKIKAYKLLTHSHRLRDPTIFIVVVVFVVMLNMYVWGLST